MNRMPRAGFVRGYAAVGLHRAKSPANVGGAVRAAHCYGASLVVVSGQRYAGTRTDPHDGYKHMPLLNCDDLQAQVPLGCVPVAVDLIEGARPLTKYTHPERAFYVFGPEDGTLGKEVLAWCRDVVYVPTVDCMNLAACVNVVLYDRMCKRSAT
jgi:tRNA(Leu) C34 or U34 (ribose-2'-O)-methylase TrmL